MGVIGILTCEVLEQEFAYLLANDKQIGRVSVLKDTKSAEIIQALSSKDVDHLESVIYLEEFTPLPGKKLEALVRVLELALHRRKQTLQDGLIQAANEMGPHVDALLLGYGLCGNALQKPDELLAGAGVPIIIPWDGDHPVDDCVGLIIGGRDNYYGEQCKTAGTWFMIPGWTYHWKRIFEAEFGNMDVPMARRLFKNYERSLLVNSPVMPEHVMKGNIRGFTEIFGFRVESRTGTLKILEDAWQSAKEVVVNKKR